jgi:DNA-binding NarL/FixJ family response regulator
MPESQGGDRCEAYSCGSKGDGRDGMRDVFLRFAGGKTEKEIAGDLSRSVKTISTHHSKIFRKLGIRTDAQLGESAVRHGHIK